MVELPVSVTSSAVFQVRFMAALCMQTASKIKCWPQYGTIVDSVAIPGLLRQAQLWLPDQKSSSDNSHDIQFCTFRMVQALLGGELQTVLICLNSWWCFDPPIEPWTSWKIELPHRIESILGPQRDNIFFRDHVQCPFGDAVWTQDLLVIHTLSQRGMCVAVRAPASPFQKLNHTYARPEVFRSAGHWP